MGIFEDLFIDIGDEQSIEDDLSTYSSHLLNMKTMMKHSHSRSLLLIDEFGGGTEPQIGGAMAEAILHRFVQCNTYGIITTHYQNLKNYAQGCPSVVNGAMLYDRTQMQPLFMLQIGNPGSSFAVEIARKIGIPEDVISYASDLVGKDYIMSDKYLQDIVRDKMYWENKRKNIHNREKQLAETVARYEEEMETFQQERKAVMAKAKEDAQTLLKESNAKIEKTIRDIREAQAEKERTKEARRELSEFGDTLTPQSNHDDPIARKIAKIKRRQERKQQKSSHQEQAHPSQPTLTPSPKVSQDTFSTLQTGNFVRLKGQNTVGRIDSINGKSARVLFGMMYTNLPLNRLEKAEAPKEDKVSKVSTFVSKETRDAMHEKKLHFRPEIDLRGMRAEEAMTATAYFIDDAIQCEQSRVRILHGTGTGTLRQLIRNYLATVPGVQSFKDEHVQFGGAGITVVILE
jgi:DNA mismatch repair protein MutS2